jgi:hypothetical protein
MTNLLSILYLLFCVVLVGEVKGQSCMHDELSKQCCFKTGIEKYARRDYPDSCIVTIIIEDASTMRVVDSIRFNSTYLRDDRAYVQCSLVCSYVAGVNEGLAVIDWE